MSSGKTENGREGVQVIARAATILRTLKSENEGMTLSQIAVAANLPRSTVQRIVAALQAEQLVISDSKGNRFRLGPELGALAETTRYNTVEQCRILLAELSEMTGETSDLSVMRGDKMIFLDQVPGTHRLRTISSVGEAFPLTTTANGKSCLALLSDDRIEELATKEWSRRGIERNMTKFITEINQIRQSGFAFDKNEHSDGVSAIGFAFTDYAGDLLSISVPVPSSRFERNRDHVLVAIDKTAKLIRKMMERS